MKTTSFENRDDWMLARRGKITGSRLKDILVKRGTGRKKGFYELIAERIAVEADGERPMDRGTRLEDIAIIQFCEQTGKKVDTTLVLWTRDDNENIAVSPDGVIIGAKDEVPPKEAVEVKCLSSASHIEAFLTQEIPSEYIDQTLQYFVVNHKLETLHVVFYDPRMTVKDYFTIEVTREGNEDKIKEYLDYQIQTLVEVEHFVGLITNLS